MTLFIHVVMLDGHEVSKTEKTFLMNWKAIRKARRRKQKRSFEQIQYYGEKIPSDAAILSVPAPPTLPALPARSLPHRCKKVQSSINDVSSKLPQLVFSEKTGSTDDENFKLPELVSYQQEHLIDALNPSHLPRTVT